MMRVKKSRNILHNVSIENKRDTWDGLIFAVEIELSRIHERSKQLTEALEIFRKKKISGEPFIRQSTRQNLRQQHSV